MLHRLREEIPLLQLPDRTGELETRPGEWYSTGEGVNDCTEPCSNEKGERGKRRGDTQQSQHHDGLTCAPHQVHTWMLEPAGPLKVTVCGDRVFREVVTLKRVK